MKRFLVIILVCLGIKAQAQVPVNEALYKVHLYEPDKCIIAETKLVNSSPELIPDRMYYWFSSGKIKATQGAYSGKLLNGQYTEFYLNKNLKERGSFKAGLKDDIWKSWNENGILTQIVTWKKGLKNGDLTLYDAKGNFIEKQVYHDDKLILTRTIGLDGQIMEKTLGENKGKRSFWSKLNIFKKH